jgi:REP element-mobilizing transposase RayT
MSTNSNLPNRQSIRLKSYDYSQQGSYFITLVTQDRIHLFGKIEDGKMILNSVGKIVEEEWIKTIQLRTNIALGEFVIMPDHIHMIITIIAHLEKKEDKEWIHSNPKSPSNTIGAIIRGFKGASTKKINLFLNSTGESPFAPTTESPFAPTSELPFAPTIESPFAPTESQFAPTEFYKNKIFQRNYYEHIIRNQQDYNRIEQYILDNPKNWKKKKLNLKIDQ